MVEQSGGEGGEREMFTEKVKGPTECPSVGPKKMKSELQPAPRKLIHVTGCYNPHHLKNCVRFLDRYLLLLQCGTAEYSP